jgi:hypothetical protein
MGDQKCMKWFQTWLPETFDVIPRQRPAERQTLYIVSKLYTLLQKNIQCPGASPIKYAICLQ